MKASNTPLRFGLVGTGYWARTTHAPSLASSDGIEFVAVWGRNPDGGPLGGSRRHPAGHQRWWRCLARYNDLSEQAVRLIAGPGGED